MANLGIRKFQDLIGRTDLLQRCKEASFKASTLDYDLLLRPALELRPNTNIVGGSVKQDFFLEKRAENKMIAESQSVIAGTQKNITFNLKIVNEERAYASTLSYHIACKYGEAGLPDGSSININLTGSAGQSFCAFLAKGINVKLVGDANDYVGKSLSGGTVVITPPAESPFESHLNVIVGNVCLYGATSGKAFFRGIAAERFCVRNSGVTAVVEGVGDHGCEYMTSGLVVILGLTGRNFAAGMSGGISYVYDIDGSFKGKVNAESVELLPLDQQSDQEVVKQCLVEFVEHTGSLIGKEMLATWPAFCKKFVKVFPYEYQRALKAQEEEKLELEISKEMKAIVNGQKNEPAVQDIEDSIQDSDAEKKRFVFISGEKIVKNLV